MTEDTSTVGRRLDLHHDPVQTGTLAICRLCRVSIDDGFVTGLRHHPQDDELDKARTYLEIFARTGEPPDCA